MTGYDNKIGELNFSKKSTIYKQKSIITNIKILMRKLNTPWILFFVARWNPFLNTKPMSTPCEYTGCLNGRNSALY